METKFIQNAAKSDAISHQLLDVQSQFDKSIDVATHLRNKLDKVEEEIFRLMKREAQLKEMLNSNKQGERRGENQQMRYTR